LMCSRVNPPYTRACEHAVRTLCLRLIWAVRLLTRAELWLTWLWITSWLSFPASHRSRLSDKASLLQLAKNPASLEAA